jgi:hypothetical protein
MSKYSPKTAQQCFGWQIFNSARKALLPTLCRNFRPIQKKNSAAEEKNSAPSNFPLLKEFWLKINTIFVCVSGKIIVWDFSIIREDKRKETILLKFGPFSALFDKSGKNSAAELSGRSTFYSFIFDLCGLTIGPMATLRIQTVPYLRNMSQQRTRTAPR